MDKWAKVRKGFTLASVGDTLWGWFSPFIPKGLFVALAWVGGIAFGLLQGMTPAGAFLFALMTGGAGTLLVNQGYAAVERIQESRFPPIHKQKMLELADALAELKSLVMHPGNWSRIDPLLHQNEHAARYQAARTKVDKIAEEVRYDTETRNTAVDFVHLCGMVVSDLLGRRDYREHWAELEKVSGPIFHRLHRGKGIRRAKIPWPQWILDNDATAQKAKLKELSTESRAPVSPDQHKQRQQIIFGTRYAAQQYHDGLGPFRPYIERNASFMRAKRHLRKAYLDELNKSVRTTYAKAHPDDLHPLAQKLLDELNILAEKWGIE